MYFYMARMPLQDGKLPLPEHKEDSDTKSPQHSALRLARTTANCTLRADNKRTNSRDPIQGSSHALSLYLFHSPDSIPIPQPRNENIRLPHYQKSSLPDEILPTLVFLYSPSAQVAKDPRKAETSRSRGVYETDKGEKEDTGEEEYWKGDGEEDDEGKIKSLEGVVEPDEEEVGEVQASSTATKGK